MLGVMTASSQAAPGSAPPAGAGEPRWLSSTEREAWQAVAALMLQLPGPLDAQLQQDSGLSLYEYLVLSSLSMAPDRTARMSELARLANGSQSRLSNVARRLEDRGWLRREPDPDDRRAKLLVLTEKGLKVRTTMMKASAEMFSAMTGLDEAGTKQLLALLSRRVRFNAV